MKQKKYYVVSLSTNCDVQGLFNQSTLIDGYELPSLEELTRRTCKSCIDSGHTPKPNSTIIVSLIRLTADEFDQLHRKESESEELSNVLLEEKLTRDLFLKVMGTEREYMVTRALNVLISSYIRTVGDLRKVSKCDLLKHRTCGKGTLVFIEDFAERCGIKIGSEL